VRESINLQLAQWPMPNPAGSELPRPALYTTVGTSVFDTVTGLEWEKDLSAQLFTWDPAAATGSAQSYCANLSKNGTGWRLPSKIELESLVDFTRVSPSLAPSFPSLGASGRFWSATPIATSGSTPLVWSVSFATGLAVPDSAGAGLSVRCVRSTTSSVPAARYTANVLANEVVDNATGLTWQEPMDLTRRTQPEARAYCPTLGTGWRAPTQKELLTLVDPRIASPGPTIDPTFFPLAPQDLVWSSSYAAGATGKGWAVNFGSGDASSSVNTTDTYSVRCVRSSATPTLPSREWALWPMPDASSFDTSSTEVIVDATTGLTWEKNVLNTIYSWGASAGTGTAQAYCTGLTTAGGGWRLPTKIELESVLDLTRNPPYYPAFDSTNSPKTVWTGTGVAGNANSAWAVSFDFQGVSGPTAIANRRHVRCVRSTPKASLAEHYSSAPSASGGGVTDIWTGLTWQASVDSTKRSHSDAETYCSTLGTGWRLPSVKELLTLVAATRKQPSIETLYFPSTPSDNFWTSTLNRTNPTTQAWYVNFTEGSSTATEPRSNLWLVRCVR
jgi:hypothetical protein